jgi:hypothetical protein
MTDGCRMAVQTSDNNMSEKSLRMGGNIQRTADEYIDDFTARP